MSQIDHCEGDIVSCQEINIFPLKTDQQTLEFINVCIEVCSVNIRHHLLYLLKHYLQMVLQLESIIMVTGNNVG